MEKYLESEKTILNPASTSIMTRGKVGNVICRVDQYGNQQSYLAPDYHDGPVTKEQEATRVRFADAYQRLENLSEVDIVSWRDKVTNPRNTYVNLIMKHILNAYYQDNASFNIIRGVRPITIMPNWAEFKFTFDVPGKYQVCWRTEDKARWQYQQDIDPSLVGEKQGKFKLLNLEPGTIYRLMVIQPLADITTEAEAMLATVENQPPPTKIKGESGHYFFHTPPF